MNKNQFKQQEAWTTVLRWAAFGVVIFLWGLSVKWSAAGLQAKNPDDPNTGMIGIGLALFITVAQLIFNRGAINPTLFVVGVCAYIYGVGTNIVGINQAFHFDITMAAFSVNPLGAIIDLLILSGLAFVIELAPEAYLLWALNPKLQRPGDAISTILGRKDVFDVKSKRSGTQTYQNQKYAPHSETFERSNDVPKHPNKRKRLKDEQAVLAYYERYYKEHGGNLPSYRLVVQNTPLSSTSEVRPYKELFERRTS